MRSVLDQIAAPGIFWAGISRPGTSSMSVPCRDYTGLKFATNELYTQLVKYTDWDQALKAGSRTELI